jgi:hypothetical protein
MSTNTMNLTGKVEKVFGTLSFDESGHCWRLASEAEPNFQRTFSTQQDAFYFWYSRFDPTPGRLRD